MRRMWIASLVIMIAVAGCSVGPEIVTPDVVMASSWIEPAASSSGPPILEWWKTLEDPTLVSYVERAVAQNHDIRIAVARVREARALRRSAAGGHYPDVEAGGGAARLRASENGFGPGPALAREGIGSLEDNLFNLNVDASWEIDVRTLRAHGSTPRSRAAATYCSWWSPKSRSATSSFEERNGALVWPRTTFVFSPRPWSSWKIRERRASPAISKSLRPARS